MKSRQYHERTLVIIKPDGVQRMLVGDIIHRLERIGLKIVASKMLVATPAQIEAHYTLDPEWRMKTGVKSIKGYTDKGLKPPSTDPMKVVAIVLKNLIKYMSSGPVIAMVWEGAHAVEIVRKLVGSTEPLSSDVGTIRGDYMLDSYRLSDHNERAIYNLIHASGSAKEANDEIKHWFKENEVVDYNIILEKVIYG
jgi:nucleoside-diphosphate kinase